MLRLRSKQIVLPIAALLLFIGTAFAQQPGMHEKGGENEGMHGCRMSEHKPMIPDLSEEQREKIKTLRVKHMEALKPLRNELGEKKARLRTLTTSDKVSMNEVNKVIDEIGKLHTRMMKLKAQHHQSVRELLTNEQRVFFDAHQPPHGGSFHEGMHRGKRMH